MATTLPATRTTATATSVSSTVPSCCGDRDGDNDGYGNGNGNGNGNGSSRDNNTTSVDGPIHKRSVSFGNPSLGTYKGFVYYKTSVDGTATNLPQSRVPLKGDDDGDDDTKTTKYSSTVNLDNKVCPVTDRKTTDKGIDCDENDNNNNNDDDDGDDGIATSLPKVAQCVDRMVAMVDVPPEQVPEGILNLARSHQRVIEHVRIVIAEPKAVSSPRNATIPTDNGILLGNAKMDDDNILKTNSHEKNMHTNQEKKEPLKHHPHHHHYHHHQQQQQHSQSTSLKYSTSDLEDLSMNRSYLILFQLLSEEDANLMIEDLNGKPYTSLDETQVCSLYKVEALQGEDGVSLLNPLFAPSTKKKHGSLNILPSSSAKDEDDDGASKNIDTTTPSSFVKDGIQALTISVPHVTEDPNCAVCLEHMSLDPEEENRASILTTVCNHTFHLECIIQCQDSPCPVCRYDHSGLNEALSQCHICGTTERNYVCLICGAVSCVGGSAAASSSHSTQSSCGTDRSTDVQRFYTSHANQHYDSTLHAYALDTETQHVWDFAGQGYVHRLLQNKEDGKLVEVNDPNNTTSQERSMTPGLSDTQEGEVVHRKLEGFANQYYTLLKSQLEQQRTFYEGRIEEIRRDFARKQQHTISEKGEMITALRQEKKQLSQRLATIKRKTEKAREDVVFLRNTNESLAANKVPLQEKIRDAQREQIAWREMLQKTLPVLEERVSLLMLKLEESVSTPHSG